MSSISPFSRMDLQKFHIKHPEASVSSFDGVDYITGLWDSDDIRIAVSDLGPNPGDVLNGLRIDSRFDAIIHESKALVEFIFMFLGQSDEWGASLLNRAFTAHYQGFDYECFFETPSEEMLALARAARRLPAGGSEMILPQMQQFRDFQRVSEMPQHVRSYFEGKVPRNFFVSIASNPDVDLPQLCRHLNLLMRYYDRLSPYIVIRSPSSTTSTKLPMHRYLEGSVPARFVVREIDDVLLTLLEVAVTSAPRSAFLYYYQVFEYAGHYYIDEKTRKALKKLLRDPAMVNCDDKRVGELFSVLGELHQHDEQRMQRVIEEHCDSAHLWPEVSRDLDFLSKPIEFDGGLRLDRIVSAACSEDAWREAFKALFPVLTKIRNCIVHAREKRESKVILPTKENSAKLAHFVPLMRRMAEDVVLRS